MEKPSEINNWYQVINADEIPSPALLVYPDRIENNIHQMILTAGGTERLRPHVKTHKTSEIIKLQMKHGINKFKCATISEAEMVADCGVKDILLAVQPVGPNIERFLRLKEKYPKAKISCIVDNEEIIIRLSDMSRTTNIETYVWLDINVGMNRTGVAPGEKAIRLYKRMIDSPMLKAGGLHVYDGHIHEHDPEERRRICNDAYAPVESLIENLKREGIDGIAVIAGGTPTFPIHAARKDSDTSPGTTILWDWGYSSSFEDLHYDHAAVLLTRVISKPAKDMLCIDLGHKAIGSEMAQPRMKILGIEKYTLANHNEEHMVVKTPLADKYKIGDVFYCVPMHICPTVDRHDTMFIIKDKKYTGTWIVEARKRKITI
jgi:D-serine deaminase-like pyridoxal phosphate-dependent protein